MTTAHVPWPEASLTPGVGTENQAFMPSTVRSRGACKLPYMWFEIPFVWVEWPLVVPFIRAETPFVVLFILKYFENWLWLVEENSWIEFTPENSWLCRMCWLGTGVYWPGIDYFTVCELSFDSRLFCCNTKAMKTKHYNLKVYAILVCEPLS